MFTAHIFISGFVQGVGFRQFIKKSAEQVRVTGWVRNLPDNRVEAILQGSKEKIDEMIAVCENGPFLSEVKNVVVEWDDNSTETFKTFEIIY